jgi:prepilin-type processing-associated H-X9-DG protein
MLLQRRSAFALPDALALAAVFSLLALVCLPRSGALQKRRQCAENLRQMGRAVQIYAEDNDGVLPGNQHSLPSWLEGLRSYCEVEVYRCPASVGTNAFNVALNDFLTPRPYGARHLDYSRLASIPRPVETLLFGETQPAYQTLKFDHFHFADSRENGYTTARFRQQVEVERHGSGANYLFPDGHIEAIAWSGAAARLHTGGSRFVHPEGLSAEQLIAAMR